MDVVGLKDAAQVGLVRCARAQPLDGRLLVAEGFEEGERKLLSIKGLLSQRGNRFFDLNGVHGEIVQRAHSSAGRSATQGANNGDKLRTFSINHANTSMTRSVAIQRDTARQRLFPLGIDGSS